MCVHVVGMGGSSFRLSLGVFLSDAQREITSRIENCPDLFSFSLWRLNIRALNQHLLSPCYVQALVFTTGL